MPEIPLIDRNGKPLSELDSHFILQAVMYAPNDKDSVSSYFALTAAGPTELFKKTFLTLSKGATGGTVAGMVFLRLLQLKIHRPDEASIGKAVFLVSTQLKQKSIAERRRTPTGRGYVEDLWVKFRPAAHLWCAAYLLDEMGLECGEDPAPYTGALVHFSDEMFKVAMAEKLDLGPDPWKLPDSYPRKPMFSRPFTVNPPDREVDKILEDYKALGRRS